MSVSCHGVSYIVIKRYSSFKALHSRLLNTPLWAVLPPLPPGRFYSRQTDRFAEERRAELNEYVHALVRDPRLRGCAEVHAFLELAMLLRRSTRNV